MALMNVIKKGLSAGLVCATSLAVRNERAAQESRVLGSAACFFVQYLHPSDPDVNHIDLLTSLLIVCSYSMGPPAFPYVRFHSRTVVAVQVFVCLHGSLSVGCLLQRMFKTDKPMSQKQNKC